MSTARFLCGSVRNTFPSKIECYNLRTRDTFNSFNKSRTAVEPRASQTSMNIVPVTIMTISSAAIFVTPRSITRIRHEINACVSNTNKLMPKNMVRHILCSLQSAPTVLKIRFPDDQYSQATLSPIAVNGMVRIKVTMKRTWNY